MKSNVPVAEAVPVGQPQQQPMYPQQPGMYQQQQPGMYQQQQPGMYQQQPGMYQQQPIMYQPQPTAVAPPKVMKFASDGNKPQVNKNIVYNNGTPAIVNPNDPNLQQPAGMYLTPQQQQLQMQQQQISAQLTPQQQQQMQMQQLMPGQQQVVPQSGGMMGGMMNSLTGGGQKVWSTHVRDDLPLQVADLSVFDTTNDFLIVQENDILEAIADQIGLGCMERANKYVVYDANTMLPLMFVQEAKDGSCQRICCEPFHHASLKIYDIRPQAPPNAVVLLMEKPLKYCGGCFNLHETCTVEATVSDPHGNLVGRQTQPYLGNGFTPTIETMDRNGDLVSKAIGPQFCIGGLMENCTDQGFDLIDPKTNVAYSRIEKGKPDGAMQHLTEALTDTDQYKYSAPPGATRETKASMLGTVILLDYLFFERGAAVQHKPDGAIQVNCFNVYCCGCLQSCTCQGGGNTDD